MSSAIPKTFEGMRDWCWEKNQAAHAKAWPHWMTAQPGPGDSFSVKTFVGEDVRQIWAMLEDKPLVPKSWGRDEISKHHRMTERRIELGVTPDVWMLWKQESRAAKRAAWVEREIEAAA